VPETAGWLRRVALAAAAPVAVMAVTAAAAAAVVTSLLLVSMTGSFLVVAEFRAGSSAEKLQLAAPADVRCCG
jgi:hypothetical protein